jgi:hypothetical protein
MDYDAPTELLKRVGEYLSVALPKEADPLIEHLRGLDACRYELSLNIADWHMKLADYKARALRPKDKDYTELDRTILLNADVSLIQKDYELLQKLEELIQARMELGMVLLGFSN